MEKNYCVVATLPHEEGVRQYDLSGWVTYEQAEEIKGRALTGLPRVNWETIEIVKKEG